MKHKEGKQSDLNTLVAYKTMGNVLARVSKKKNNSSSYSLSRII